ncbi:MAG: glutathione synthetase ATP-binding domain [Trebouxia sp. A1-2]|nr:MAG: glutathione synthetase ATP-binding domain [Trebouxia sp. A1-2]
MKKASALTAALSGKRSDAPSSVVDDFAKHTDSFSFPCLDRNGKESTSGVDDVTHELEKASLKGQTIAGSSRQTCVHFVQRNADYELNPYRRRGGEERVPTPQASVDDRLRWTSLGSASLQSNFMADALIGSLPQGLSINEREKIFANTPLSPTLSMLSSMPSDKVGSRTLEGRRLRRHVLKGAVIIFITAGYSGKRFIFEKAKELGVRSVIIDGPDSWCQTLQDDKMIEKFIGIDFSDAESVFDKCLAACKKVQKDLGELDGVCTFCEMAVPLVSRIAESLGLSGNSPAAVDAARDKHSTRAKMAAAGLPTPRNMLVQQPSDLKPAAEMVKFPAVIKPIYGAASIGVVRVNDMPQLEQAYKRVTRELAKAHIVAGALQQGEEDDEDSAADQAIEATVSQGNADSWIKLTLMLEEYLDGPEVDVDLVLSEGQAVYGAITDNWPTVEPYFNETGSNCPSILPTKQQQELMQMAVQSTQCLGFKQGVFHVELKYTSRGPRLIEVNCRMGGGPVRNTNLLVWGVDLVEEHLLTCAGIPSRPPIAAKPLMYIAEYSINAQKTGKMQHIDFLKDWQNHPDVLYARALVQKGQKVTCVTDGMPTWVCELMVVKPSVEEAITFVKAIDQALDIPIV